MSSGSRHSKMAPNRARGWLAFVVAACVACSLRSSVEAQGQHRLFNKQMDTEPVAFGSLAASQQQMVFSFYLHDNLDTRPSSSAFTVVPAVGSLNGNGNPHYFGAIAVFDDAMTEGPDVNSKSMGRGRGFYVFNSMDNDGASLEFVWTAVFNDASGFGGSTLSFKGYDKINDPEREIAITGGTGKFRLARGWAIITTSTLNGGAAKLYITCNVFYGA